MLLIKNRKVCYPGMTRGHGCHHRAGGLPRVGSFSCCKARQFTDDDCLVTASFCSGAT